jgi:hypothetical protein
MKRSGRSKRHLEGTAKLPRKWAAFVAALALAVLGIGAVSCGGSHRGRKGSSRPAASKTTARTNEPSAALPATGASSAVATADAGAGQSPGADVPSTEMAPERPPRNAAPGSTKGTIACGTVRCTLGQACIWEADTTRIGGNDESRWRCVPLGTSQAEVERVFQADHYLCDDSSDCGPRGACCFGFATGSENASCTPREGPRSECRNELCVEGDGAACPNGLMCRGGVCEAEQGATCADLQRCPKERPVCLWSAAPTCVAEDTSLAESSSARLGCTLPSDCGPGRQCCAAPALGSTSYCANHCFWSLEVVLCSRDTDCPVFGGKQLNCVSAAGVGGKDQPMPPWAKVCSQD